MSERSKYILSLSRMGKTEQIVSKSISTYKKQIKINSEKSLNIYPALLEPSTSSSNENKTSNVKGIKIIQNVKFDNQGNVLSPDLNENLISVVQQPNFVNAYLCNDPMETYEDTDAHGLKDIEELTTQSKSIENGDFNIENMDILFVNDNYYELSSLNKELNSDNKGCRMENSNNADKIQPVTASSLVVQDNLQSNFKRTHSPVEFLESDGNMEDNKINETEFENKKEKERNLENTIDEVVADYGDLNEGRKRRKIAAPKMWSKEVNKTLRMEGKEYLGYTRKNKVIKHDKIREARKMGASCTSLKCANSITKMCEKFSEQVRKKLFNCFWNETNWDQRKIFVSSHVESTAVQRKTTDGESRRNRTLKYTLPLNGQKLPVCRQMFLSTLSIGSFTVQSWVKESNKCNMATYKKKRNLSRKVSKKEKLETQMQSINQFLDELPKLPSHYNRANTRKLYLEPIIKNMAELIELYKRYCNDNNVTPLSRQVFRRHFNEKNISLHKSKKDKCDTCVQYEVGNLEKSKWQEHHKKKERAREEKRIDKIHAAENACITLTLDLEAVKLAPCINASSIYFKTKLACHNFTIYDLNTHEVTCYWFNETDTDLNAPTFVSCLIDYLTENCIEKNLPIVIYSDGCTYQKRNSIMANALLHLAVTKNVEIIQKFLEPGHTQMECDSVHSCIERKLTNREIYLPSDYIKATKEARLKPFPYKVKDVDYTFFKNYDDPRFIKYTSIRPGRKAGDPTVTDLRVIAYNYEKSGNIEVKLNFDEEFQCLPIRAKILNDGDFTYENLHKSRRPIKKTKWDHLQSLKSELPKDCHYFYDQLPKSS